MNDHISTFAAVRARYAAAAQTAEPALCCAVTYDSKYLAVLPEEILQRDYGCGDPSRAVLPGETVLDLGCGGGKICYIASQIVGPRGRVIGIDVNEEMLSLARRHQPEIAQRIGWDNVRFERARIQDLRLSLDALDELLREHPPRTAQEWCDLEDELQTLRVQRPLIASGTMDVVLSNCVLNLVSEGDREQLFAELFRVLRPQGRAVISDIVASQEVPSELRSDPQLWSGCLSGAFEEGAFFRAFAAAGFERIHVLARQEQPWQVVDGIEFRSVTVKAVKGDSARPGASIPILDETCCTDTGCC